MMRPTSPLTSQRLVPSGLVPSGLLRRGRVCVTALSFALIAMVGFSSVHAAGLDASHVPADAKWVVHVDYESLSDSAMWEKVRNEKPLASKMVQNWMKNRYGIDPPKDLKSLTLFSRDYREYTGTVIVQADYDAEKIKQRVSKSMNHRKTQWQDYTLHTITLSKQESADDGPSGDEEMTIVLVDDDTMVLGSSVPNTKEALKLLGGKSPSLAKKDSKLLSDRFDEAWFYGAAIELGDLKKHPVAMPIIAQHDRITWSFGKNEEGMLYEKADLVAESEEVATQMKTVLEGLVAYEKLWSSGSEPMTALMQNVNVHHDGKTTGFDWQGEPDQVVAAMGDVFDRLKTWKPMLMKDRQGYGKQGHGKHGQTKKHGQVNKHGQAKMNKPKSAQESKY